MTTVESAREAQPEAEVLLEAQDLKKYFPVTRGLLVSKVTGWIKAVDGNFLPDPGRANAGNSRPSPAAARAPPPRCC